VITGDLAQMPRPAILSVIANLHLLFDQFVLSQNRIHFRVARGRVATSHRCARSNQKSSDFRVVSSWFAAVLNSMMQPARRQRMKRQVFDIERRLLFDQQLGEIGISLPARPVQGGTAVLSTGIDRQASCQQRADGRRVVNGCQVRN